jgi:hypothetical protein
MGSPITSVGINFITKAPCKLNLQVHRNARYTHYLHDL